MLMIVNLISDFDGGNENHTDENRIVSKVPEITEVNVTENINIHSSK